MVYKWCIVPLCTNTTLKKPDKLFVSVPTKPEKRKLWLQLAHRDPKSILSHTNVFMCEDHFNMEKDTINYMKYKMGFSQKILLANEAVPTKFHCQKDRRISDISTSLQEYANVQPGVTVKKEEDIRPMPVVLVRCALAIPDTLESADCVRVKTEPLWDLSASCVPETARPIERAVKLERVSDDDDEATWDAIEPQTAGLIERAVKLERVSDDDEATWDAIEPQTAGLVEHVMKIKGWDDGDNASWDVEGFCDPEAQAGHIDHVVKAEGSESEGNEALWRLYNNHEVKKELVLGPEEFQRPKVTLVCQGGGILSNLTCSVRLEQMRVDMKSHTCSISRHTYKFRQCFLSYEDYCTEEGSTSNKLDKTSLWYSRTDTTFKKRAHLKGRQRTYNPFAVGVVHGRR
ncbi:uncharacterized protein LOC134752246 isoform X2 [Cydia strobilella]|uniref:uncharacterized protein LOC134752246 isoform X2 n=1 Tax=Cydia strobilella TaxID=1100964 RepID=UPI003007B7A3